MNSARQRCDERGVDLLEAIGADDQLDPLAAAEISGVGAGPLDPDVPLPWDFIVDDHMRMALRRSFDARRDRGHDNA